MKTMSFAALVLFCCLAGSAFAQESDCCNQPIPKDYGRLAGVIAAGRTSSLLFFEASDGTIRTVKIQVQDKTHYRICNESLNYTINRN
jgi:hypothetical protein